MVALHLPAALAQRLAFASPGAYGMALGELERWAPLVRFCCAQHDIAPHEIVLGEIGTYPTCLVDGLWVVKLCGPWFGGYANVATEEAVLAALADLDPSQVSRLVHQGLLVAGEGEIWHYLISTVLPGEPIIALREQLTVAELIPLCRELGHLMRLVHGRGALVAGALPAERRDFRAWLRGQYDALPTTWAARGSLPERWAAQAQAYCLPPDQLIAQADRLLHGDITGDHILIDRSNKERRTWSLIDWGDARLGDPYYELVALYLEGLAGQMALLDAFRDGYGWPWETTSTHRAMSCALLFEFDVLGPHLRRHPELTQRATLEELAVAIWERQDRD